MKLRHLLPVGPRQEEYVRLDRFTESIQHVFDLASLLPDGIERTRIVRRIPSTRGPEVVRPTPKVVASGSSNCSHGGRFRSLGRGCGCGGERKSQSCYKSTGLLRKQGWMEEEAPAQMRGYVLFRLERERSRCHGDVDKARRVKGHLAHLEIREPAGNR